MERNEHVGQDARRGQLRGACKSGFQSAMPIPNPNPMNERKHPIDRHRTGKARAGWKSRNPKQTPKT